MVEKRYKTAADSLADLEDKGIIRDGMTVMVGGFGLCGIPEHAGRNPSWLGGRFEVAAALPIPSR